MTVNIDSLNINYVCRGQGDAVLLLHGWGSNITLFADTIALLEAKYTVIAPDLPGFGQSDEPPEPWSVDDYVDFIIKFISLFNLDKLTVLGHSFGGRVIIKLFSRKTQFKIDKVILVDSAGVMPEKTAAQKLKGRLISMSKKAAESKVINAVFSDLIEQLRERSGSADYNAASPLMKKTLVKVVNEDLCPFMPAVTCPVLLIWGRNDTATPLADAEKMERLMPQAGLAVIENAGHFSFIDQRAVFLRILASFMDIPLE